MMEAAVALTVFAGIMIGAAAGCVTAWAVLMAPDRPNYPTGSKKARAGLALLAAILLFRCGEIISSALSWREAGLDGPVTMTFGQIVASGMILFVFAALLEDHLRRWLTPRQQAWVARMWEMASCAKARKLRDARAQSNANLRPGVVPSKPADPAEAAAALVTLAEAGVVVVPPDAPRGAGLIDSLRPLP